QTRAHRARDLADARSGADGDRALARSDLQPAAPALGHRHAEPRRLRGAVLGSPRSGLTQVSTRTGQDHATSAAVEAFLRLFMRAVFEREVPKRLRSVGTSPQLRDSMKSFDELKAFQKVAEAYKAVTGQSCPSFIV